MNYYSYRDAMIVPFVNCGTSVFAGFVIFSVLGFMAHEANSTVDQIVTQGRSRPKVRELVAV